MNVKKLIALLLALALILLAGCGAAKSAAEPEPEPTAEPEPEPVEEETGPSIEELTEQMEALMQKARTAFPGDTPVCSVDGEDVDWDLFFSYLSEDLYQFLYYSIYYTGTLDVDLSTLINDDTSVEDYLKQTAELQSKYYALAHTEAVKAGVPITEEQQAKIQEQMEGLEEKYGGAEALDEALADSFMSREVFTYRVACGEELGNLLKERYGAAGEKLTPEELEEWAAEKGYVRVKHILYSFYGDDGAELDEEGKAGRRSEAEAALAELRELAEDHEALEARFTEIMNEDSGDAGGLSGFPDGYTFTAGTMYDVFEDAAFALEEFGLSEIVESVAGYHIILRLPLDPAGATMDQDSNTGEYLSLGANAANDLFSTWLAGLIKDTEVEWYGDFKDLSMQKLLFGE